MKKILFMVQVPPPVHGAALRNQSLLDSLLLQQNFIIRLQALSFADSLDSIGKISSRKIIKAFVYAKNLFVNLIKFKPDIAYFTLTPAGGVFYRDCLFVLILKLFNVKIIYHLRGLGVYNFRTKNKLNRLAYQLVFSNSYVVCLSHQHLLDVRELNYIRHFVVPNGIKTEVKPEFLLTQKTGKTRLLYFSNFIKSKGVLDFIDALSKLKQRRDDFEVLLVGADFDLTAANLQQYIDEKKLTQYVTISGPRYGDEKFKTICACDVFVFPTYFELFPGVVLEAMQCGRPIISTLTGAIPEIIDNGVNGLLVEPRNTEDLMEKINYLLTNPDEARRLGENAKRKFEDSFTLDRFERNMKQVFDEV